MPIEQMYLDKALRDHNLLQAMLTNRVYKTRSG